MYSNFDEIKFAQRVKAKIKENHITQEELGRKIGYSRKSINHFINNPKSLPIFLINAFCKELEIIDLKDFVINICNEF